MGVLVKVYIKNFLCSAKAVDFEAHRQMAILNATAMKCERVNFSWSVSVQKCQQIVETVAARHRGTLNYCLSRYSIVSQSLFPALGRCPHGARRRPLSHSRSGSGSGRLAPNARLGTSSIRPRTLGSL